MYRGQRTSHYNPLPVGTRVLWNGGRGLRGEGQVTCGARRLEQVSVSIVSAPDESGLEDKPPSTTASSIRRLTCADHRARVPPAALAAFIVAIPVPGYHNPCVLPQPGPGG